MPFWWYWTLDLWQNYLFCQSPGRRGRGISLGHEVWSLNCDPPQKKAPKHFLSSVFPRKRKLSHLCSTWFWVKRIGSDVGLGFFTFEWLNFTTLLLEQVSWEEDITLLQEVLSWNGSQASLGYYLFANSTWLGRGKRSQFTIFTQIWMWMFTLRVKIRFFGL